MPGMFSNYTFNTARLPSDAVIFDDAGLIDPGPLTGSPAMIAGLGYNAPYFYQWISSSLVNGGYGATFTDLTVDFPDATFFYGITHAINTTVFENNGILGSSGADVIVDPGGTNIIDAGGGDDLVLTGAGADAIRAGDGDDLVFSGDGDDIVDGGQGNDRIFLRGGDDYARGRAGNDEIHGEDGADHIWGNAGKDQLFGGSGDDVISGGGGADRIGGGDGNDIMSGGNGKDVFLYDLSDDQDVITDFDAARDTIELDQDLGVSSFGGLTQVATQIGADLVFDFGNGDVLTLNDTTMSDLSANDFLFV